MTSSALTLRLLLGVATVSPLALSSECGEPTPPPGTPATLDPPPSFAQAWPLRTPIPADAPVDPDSALYVARMAGLQATGGFLMPINTWSRPVFYADATTPRYDVALTVYGAEGGYFGKHFLLDVPIPSYAVEDPESDAALIIVDRDRGCVYDFWGYDQGVMENPNAWWASGIPLDGDGISHTCLSAGTAGGFSGLGALVSPTEISAGVIEHALEFAMEVSAVRGGGPVLPATSSDGASTDMDALPEGALVQLDPELDLATLGLSPQETVIARALQVYGMYLADRSGGGLRIGAVSGLSASPNPWDGVVPDAEADSLSLDRIPVSRMRVIELPPPWEGVRACEDNPCGQYL